MSFKIVEHTLSGDLAAAGTFTFSHPTGMDEDSYAAYGHVAISRDTGAVLTSPSGFTLTPATASTTFTLGSGQTTIPAGSRLYIQVNLPGADSDADQDLGQTLKDVPGVSEMKLVRVDLGSPLVADVNAIAESQDLDSGGAVTLAATLANGDGVVDLTYGAGGSPFGRAVNVDSGESTSGVVTITGTDWQGNAMVEAITLNDTTAVAGKKAFATITSASVDADSGSGFIIGTIDVFGLPFFLPGVDDWVTELEDGVTATAGTFVAGVSSAASATSGDVRGTYDPNSAADGGKNFVLYLAVGDPNYQGISQYAG